MEPVAGVVILVVLAVVVTAGVALVAAPRKALPAPPPAPAPEPAEAAPPRAELVPVAPEELAGERWVPVLAAVAPIAAIGAWLHHRRFVQYHERKGSAPTTTFRRWVAAETRGIGMLGWWQVRAFLRDGLRIPADRVGRTVLCLHGYTQNATNFHGLRGALEADGRATVAVSLGYRLAPIGWYAHRLERVLERLGREHPEGIDIVAHSMGGVVLRMALAARPELRGVVHTVVTLGSPHRGTAAARGIPWIPEIRALKRRSELLAGLPQLPELLPHARVVTVAGAADTIVYPLETALVTGAHHVVLPGVSHAGLLTDRVAWDAVRDALRA